jgi:arylsulfatase A-like enzyme
VTTYDTAATALYALGIPVPAEFDGKPVVSAFQAAK